MVDEAIVKVLTTKMSVTGGGLDFENAIFNSQKWNIKGTTTKIKDKNIVLALLLFIKTIGNGCSSRFVDDAEHIETSD